MLGIKPVTVIADSRVKNALGIHPLAISKRPEIDVIFTLGFPNTSPADISALFICSQPLCEI